MSDPTEIKFACWNCNQHISAPAGLAAEELDCPNCQAPVKVPEKNVDGHLRLPMACPRCLRESYLHEGKALVRQKCGQVHRREAAETSGEFNAACLGCGHRFTGQP